MPYLDEQTFNLYARDVGTQLTPNATQKTTLIVAGCYVIVIAILWHVPVLSWIIYPFKLLTVGFHEMSHAIAGILTCATIHSVELDPDEGGETRMSGGIPWITLPAGYLGSSFIGAALIACGFDTNASKIACIVLGVFFIFTLWWARKNWLTWILILGMSGLIVLFWLVADSVALRYFILFVGVMSDLYVLWDVIDDTIARKVNSSDASAFARVCGCFPSQVWGVIWLVVAFMYFAAGIIVGLVAFKESTSEQESAAAHFLPAPGSSGAMTSVPLPGVLLMIVTTLSWKLLL
ncbi:peptidase M50B-like-domain-containing protein [Suillus variegatus]|nr:peptidase M50B-like-domain-containing protein [Suillus variegatus]